MIDPTRGLEQLDGDALSRINAEFIKAQHRLLDYKTGKRKSKDELEQSYRALEYLMDQLQAPVIDVLTQIHKIIGDVD